MLERASPSIECTTHLLLKTFERPTRSCRILGPTFWKHAGDTLDVPVWWPAYLHNIRQKADTNTNSPRGQTVLNSSVRTSKTAEIIKNVPKSSSHRAATTRRRDEARAFTACALHRQQQSAHNRGTENKNGYDLHSQTSQPKRRGNAVHTIGLPYSKMGNEPHETRSPHHNETKTDYEGVWKLFVQSGHKKEVAANMLHYLAGSHQRTDLQHALTVFDFIPAKQRKEIDYEIAIDVATRSRNYRAAVRLNSEALSKGWGYNAYFKLMAHCVEHTLWNTLATLWESTLLAGKPIIRKDQEEPKSRSPNMAGKYAYHFDAITDMPAKVITLANRLSQSDAVLAAHRDVLVEVCKRLAYIAVENSKAMSSITGKGILALLDVQKQLGFDSKLHLAAIGTIRRFEDKGSKARLAMLIYRNFCFAYPDTKIPLWVYGALIGICADAREPPSTHQFLLDDIAKWYGHADVWSLQQVMAACAQQGEVEAVFKAFTEFCRISRPKDLRDVNHLLHVFAVTGDTENTQAQFDRLRPDFGLTPDVFSWTLLLLAHARSTRPETAFDIFDRMKAGGIRPNTVSWSIITNVAASRGDTAKARQLYAQAKEENVTDSVYMLTSIVESMLLNNEAKEAEVLVLKASEKRAADSPIRLWNSLFRYHAFRGDSTSIHRIQGLMKALDVKPDAMTYAALMTALVVKGQTSDAAKILKTLHFSRHLNPTEFHYSILIHGFTLEGKRQLATSVYQEMLEHFPRPSPSAKLAMLKLQLQRETDTKQPLTASDMRSSLPDTSADLMKQKSMEMLMGMLIQDPRVDAASPLPKPGFRRQSGRHGLEAMYMGSLIAFLQRKDAYNESGQLLKTIQAFTSTLPTSPTITISTSTLRMIAAIEEEQWLEVDQTWREIFSTASKAFSPRVEGDEQQLPNTNALAIFPATSVKSSSKPEVQPHNIDIIGSEDNTFRSMLPHSLTPGEARVLPGHRFAVSWPLSLYLQALGRQHRHHDAVIVIKEVQAIGFGLNGRNWNRYIQVLTKSTVFDHHVLAFDMFEKHVLRFAPPWNIIRRGKWLPRQHERVSAQKVHSKPSARVMLERSNPTLLMPSYFTMIHLATALARAHRSMVAGESAQFKTLQAVAPGTVNLVRSIPYLPDRVQAVLMRGQRVRGDKLARSRNVSLQGNFPGIKSSESPLDNVPPSVLENLQEILAPRSDIGDDVRKKSRDDPPTVASGDIHHRYAEHVRREEARSGVIQRTSQYLADQGRFERSQETHHRVKAEEYLKLQPYLDLAQNIMGDMHTGPQFLAAQGRMETEEEVKKRLLLQTVQRLDMVEQIRQDLRNSSFSNTLRRGEVAIGSLPQSDEPIDKVTDAKLLIEKFASAPGRAAVQNLIEHRLNSGMFARGSQSLDVNAGEEIYSNNAAKNTETDQLQSFEGGSLPATGGSPRTHRSSDTSSLRRRVSEVYQSPTAVPPIRVEPRRRGAWSINKAFRRQKLQEIQQQARQHRKMLKEFQVKEAKTPAFGAKADDKGRRKSQRKRSDTRSSLPTEIEGI